MRASNYSYVNNRVAFGTNKGFLEAAEKLKKRITPEEIDVLDAHSQDVVKDPKFLAQVNTILEDEKVPQLLKKIIKDFLNLK